MANLVYLASVRVSKEIEVNISDMILERVLESFFNEIGALSSISVKVGLLDCLNYNLQLLIRFPLLHDVLQHDDHLAWGQVDEFIQSPLVIVLSVHNPSDLLLRQFSHAVSHSLGISFCSILRQEMAKLVIESFDEVSDELGFLLLDLGKRVYSKRQIHYRLANGHARHLFDLVDFDVPTHHCRIKSTSGLFVQSQRGSRVLDRLNSYFLDFWLFI